MAIYDTPAMEAFEKYGWEPERFTKITLINVETRMVPVPGQTTISLKRVRKSRSLSIFGCAFSSIAKLRIKEQIAVPSE
jgi:hypothetical protein